jgi:hypothetical protein
LTLWPELAVRATLQATIPPDLHNAQRIKPSDILDLITCVPTPYADFAPSDIEKLLRTIPPHMETQLQPDHETSSPKRMAALTTMAEHSNQNEVLPKISKIVATIAGAATQETLAIHLTLRRTLT